MYYVLKTTLFLAIISISLQQEFQTLTRIFEENLLVDPRIIGNNGLSVLTQRFLDEQIHNYKNLVYNKASSDQGRLKRHVESSKYLLELKSLNISLPVTSALDIEWFEQNGGSYLALLRPGETNHANTEFILYSYKNNFFQKIASIDIENGKIISILTLSKRQSIVAIVKTTEKVDSLEIYEYNDGSSIKHVQTIKTNSSIVDIKIWQQGSNDIFLAAAAFQSLSNLKFNIKSPIYKWRNNYFDLLQEIDTHGAKMIEAFTVESNNFLAIANYKSDEDRKVYSEIYLFNVDTEMFGLHQRLTTKNCLQIQHFVVGDEDRLDYFLIEANYLPKDDVSSLIIYKMVDEYFLPFQILQLPGHVSWTLIPNQNVITIIGSGLLTKLYIFNNWIFEEQTLKSDLKLNQPLKYNQINKKPTLTTFDEDHIQTIEIKLTGNPLNNKGKHDQLLNWCQKTLKELDDFDEDSPRQLLVGIPSRADIEEVEVDSSITSRNVTSNNLVLDSEQSVIEKLEHYESQLKIMQRNASKLFQLSDKNVIDTNVVAKTVIFKKSGFPNDLKTTLLNNINVDHFLSQTLNINRGFQMTDMHFNFARFNGLLVVNMLNGVPFNDLAFKNKNLEVNNLFIHGKVIMNEPLSVYDKVNTVRIHKDSILLIKTPQIIKNCSFKDVQADSMKIQRMNNVNLIDLENFHREPVTISSLNKLKVKNLFVEGLINNISVSYLDKHALRKVGDQQLESAYFFDTLNVEDINIAGTLKNDYRFSDIFLTEGIVYETEKNFQFLQEVNVKNLAATNFLGHIPVINGQLDILRSDTSELQYMKGVKTFEHVLLTKNFQMTGKFNDDNARKSILNINDNIVTNQDVTILSNVHLDDLLQVKDIISKIDSSYSLLKAQKEGLLLAESQITNKFKFKQQLNVEEIIVEEINSIDPNSWVVTGSDSPEIITGSKWFLGDVIVTGETQAFRINNVNLSDLETNVLLLSGNQTVQGKHSIQFISSSVSPSVENVIFGPNSWSNVLLFNEDQVVTGTTTMNALLLANFSIIKNLNVNGLINGVNFNEIINDVVFTSTTELILGQKTFSQLNVNKLKVNQPLDNLSSNTIFQIKDNLELGNISVENIKFSQRCNGFNQQYLETIYVDQLAKHSNFNSKLKHVKILGNVFVKSNQINGVNITDLVNGTVKIDEPQEFKSAVFDSVNTDFILTSGQIENFDISNIIDLFSNEQQVIEGSKTFIGSLTVNGTVSFNKNVNGGNFASFCNFAKEDNSVVDQLEIQGNAFFKKDPIVHNINGVNMKNLAQFGWLSNRETTITGNFLFNNVEIKTSTKLGGLINDVNITDLNDNYFSKTKNQVIAGDYTFTNGVNFLKDVATPEVITEIINTIRFAEFKSEVLLNGTDQLFEHTPLIENCFIEQIDGDFFVNGLNLETDILRYDKTNIMTGRKEFQNLNITTLKLQPNVTVQNVDLWNWLTKVVLTEGTFQIDGTKTFRRLLTENPISLTGYLNNGEFSNNTIMLRNTPQDIIGEKIFAREDQDPIKFESIKLKGLINNIDFLELVNNQAYKNKENNFKSKLALHNNLTTKNIQINGFYNNISVNSLLSSVTTLGALNNFKVNFRDLLDMSTEIKRSLLEKSYLFRYFKPVITLHQADKAFGLTNKDGSTELVVFGIVNNTCLARFYDMNMNQGIFIEMDNKMDFGRNVRYYETLNFGQHSYVYLETKLHEPQTGFIIYFAKIIDMLNRQEIVQLQTNGTQTVVPAMIQDKKYIIVVPLSQSVINVFYLNSGQLYSHQNIPLENVKMVSTLTINKLPFMIVLNSKTIKQSGAISVWKMNNQTHEFELHQLFYEEQPNLIASVEFREDHFMVSSFAHLDSIVVSRYNKKLDYFEPRQTLNVGYTPLNIQMAVLPSNELFLYVQTDRSLMVYKYKGIVGFDKIIQTPSTLASKDLLQNWFTSGNMHFINIKEGNDLKVVQAIFDRPLWNVS